VPADFLRSSRLIGARAAPPKRRQRVNARGSDKGCGIGVNRRRFLLILARQQRHDQASAVTPTNYGKKVVTQILKFNGVPFRVSLWRPFARQREPVL
jgi:hypothetical protein